jgi:predicted Zn-dependent protease with MMP-like domain
MEKKPFEEIVEEALMALPEEFSRKLENVEVVVEDEPSEEALRRVGARRGSLLGLYHGVPLKRKSVWATPTLPGRISIYRIPILAIARTREEIRHRVRHVVIHEIGHHFGLSDRDMTLYDRELAEGKTTRPPRKRRRARGGQKP